jgi:hypothetical protein
VLFIDGSRENTTKTNVSVVWIMRTKRKNMSEQYFIKKNGRYVAVNDPYAYDGLGIGSWMVVVHKNGLSARSLIKPKNLELQAALFYLKEFLTKEMSDASKMRPTTEVMSKKEQKAWKVFRKIVGNDMPRFFKYDSICDIVEKACDKFSNIIVENNFDIDDIKTKYEVKKHINSTSGMEV